MALLERARARLRTGALLQAATAAAATVAVVMPTAMVSGASRLTAFLIAVGLGVALAAKAGLDEWKRWTPSSVAELIEASFGGFDNLLITSVQHAQRPGRVLPFIRDAVAAQAEARLAGADFRYAFPFGRAVRRLVIWTIAAVAFPWALSQADRLRRGAADGEQTAVASAEINRVDVVVTPPEYTSRQPERFLNPGSVTALAGSRVRVMVATSAPEVTLHEPAAEPVTLQPGDGARVMDMTADRSRTVVLRATAGAATADRVLSLIVSPDHGPAVRISAPGQDVVLPESRPVDLRVEATDDLALKSVALKYTKVSGSGESFTFQEGEVPLDVARENDRRWTGTLRWALEALKLEDGDSVVYRAVARDRNPAGEEASSESYLVEIGKRSEIAASGFALPEDDRRYAISQQMVIVKTERLQGDAASLSREALLERSIGIGVEQRMVKAEFVFLSGGEVEDEVVEAEQSHELVEGRLENLGRAEMLRAIAAMTRAEERLNQGDTVQALVHERAALQSLQRAFDRRRYFLRVMPERARIDPSRRLAGKLTDARSWLREATRVPADAALERERQLLRDLAGPIVVTSDLAARVAAVDPESPEWQAAAAVMMTDRDVGLDRAIRMLIARGLARLGPSSGRPLPSDPHEGRLADELRRGGQR